MSDYSIYDKTIAEIIASQDEADTQYKKVGNASTTNCDINQTVNQIPNMEVIRNIGGEVIGYDYKYTTPKLPDIGIIEIDSNTDSGEYDTKGKTRKYVGTVETDPQSTDKLKGGGFLSGLANIAWTAVSVLSKLGKTIDNSISLSPFDMIDTIMTGDFEDILVAGERQADEAIKQVRVLYKTDPNTGEVTQYIDEDTLGAIAISAKETGFFEDAEGDSYFTFDRATLGYTLKFNYTPSDTLYNWANVKWYNPRTGDTITAGGAKWYIPMGNTQTELKHIVGVSDEPFTYINLGNYITGAISTGNATPITVNGVTYYVYENYNVRPYYVNQTNDEYYLIKSGSITRNSTSTLTWGSDETQDIIKIIYGNSDYHTPSVIPGVSNQPNATIPVDAITGADPHVVAQNLESQYPGVMGTPVLINVMDDSCNEVTKKYYSIPFSYSPTNLNVVAPVTGGFQVSPSFNPDIQLDLPDIDMDNYIDQIIKVLDGSGAGRDVTIEPTINITPETPLGPDTPSKDIPGGTLPVVIPQTGTGDTPEWTPDAVVSNIHLWSVYMCTPAQLESFSKWLWIDSNIVNDLKRIVQNPMDAILGLHKIYVTPVYGNGTIVVGNIDTQVGAFPVTNQYKSLNCGNVWLTEYFGNVFDYEPYTEISLYLPFIGIVSLSPTDVMRGEIQIQYTVDVYTGACIAEVSVYRDGVGGVLYQYDGNCAVEYPITSISYNNALSMAMGIASGVIGATGSMLTDNPLGALTSLVSGISSGVMGRRNNISRSGGFSGNAGAMGSKKPYLIISRPMPQTPEDFESIEGYSSNQTVEIGNTSGYIECRHVVLEIGGAYKSEIDEIMQYLNTGIYV